MDFYKNMCDGELLAYHRAAKRSVGVSKSMEAELAKIEKEISNRKLDSDDTKAFKELSFYASKIASAEKDEKSI